MIMQKTNAIVSKYEDVIKEELNIKQIGEIQDIKSIKTIIKPIGTKLSQKYSKDTGAIIQNGKAGNYEMLGWGKLKVFSVDKKNERILDQEDYEVAYEGIQGDNMIAEWWIVVRMDLTLTPDLIQEWVAREISRFLNQMRKDANYKIEQKVNAIYYTQDKALQEVMTKFSDFLCDEALLTTIQENKNPQGDIQATFENDGQSIIFALTQ